MARRLVAIGITLVLSLGLISTLVLAANDQNPSVTIRGPNGLTIPTFDSRANPSIQRQYQNQNQPYVNLYHRISASVKSLLSPNSKPSSASYEHYLIRLSDTSYAARTRIQTQYNIKLTKLFSSDAYDVVVDKAQVDELAMDKDIEWMGRPLARHRISKSAIEPIISRNEAGVRKDDNAQNEDYDLVVVLSRNIDSKAMSAEKILDLWKIKSQAGVSSRSLADTNLLAERFWKVWTLDSLGQQSSTDGRDGNSNENNDDDSTLCDSVNQAGLEDFNAYNFRVDSGSTILFTPSKSSGSDESARMASILWVLCQSNVLWVERMQKMRLWNQYSSAISQSGAAVGSASVDNTPLWQHNVDGKGQIVHVTDTGVDYDNCFFRDEQDSYYIYDEPGCNSTKRKVKCLWSTANDLQDENGHGTHVFGTVLGLFVDFETYSNNDSLFLGMSNGIAPRATGVFTDISNAKTGSLVIPANVGGSFFSDGYNQGARVVSNSWGCDPQTSPNCNVYDSLCRSADDFMYKNMDSLVLFAAGNSGTTPSTNDGMGTIASPGTAKNIISVGATQSSRPGHGCFGTMECDSQNLAQFSSRGPTFDDRIKPDLVFPGENIFSGRTSTSVTDYLEGGDQCDNLADLTLINSGTSMATPGTAGAALLIRQYLSTHNIIDGSTSKGSTDEYGPSSALIKAMLVHSAEIPTGYFQYVLPNLINSSPQKVSDASNPRALSGRGLVNLRRVVKFSDDNDTWANHNIFIYDRYTLQSNGESLEFRFEATSVDSTFKASLVYTDPPGPVTDSSNVLINDLDISFTCSGNGCRHTSLSSSSRTDNLEQIVDDVTTLKEFQVHDSSSSRQSEFTPLTLTLVVRAEKIAVDTQPFALVVTGYNISQTQVPPSNWTPKWTSNADPTDGSNNYDDGSSGGLSTGAIIGIAIGAFACVVLIAVAAWFLFRKGVFQESEP